MSLLKFEDAFECYLNFISLLEMLNGDVIRRSKPVPVTVHLSSMEKRFGR